MRILPLFLIKILLPRVIIRAIISIATIMILIAIVSHLSFHISTSLLSGRIQN